MPDLLLAYGGDRQPRPLAAAEGRAAVTCAAAAAAAASGAATSGTLRAAAAAAALPQLQLPPPPSPLAYLDALCMREYRCCMALLPRALRARLVQLAAQDVAEYLYT
jgi:hypothetical protein